MLVEQAIFASAQTDHAQGYQLVARSPGLSERDARELISWCPSHDSLWDGTNGCSVNFFPLGEETYCLSKTLPAGHEYSGRGGADVRTQCLIVPAAVAARFANNPFAMLRAAEALGALSPQDACADRLEPIRLVGRAPLVDQLLLAQLALSPGPLVLATLVHEALANPRLIVAGSAPDLLLSGLMSCLPYDRRTEFAFSTGLRLSACRPLRIAAAPTDNAELRRFAQQAGAAVLDLTNPPGDRELGEWAKFVYEALSDGKTTSLANELALKQIDVGSVAARTVSADRCRRRAQNASTEESSLWAADEAQPHGRLTEGQTFERLIRIVDHFGSAEQTAERTDGPPKVVHTLAANDPAAVEMLERLDDLIYNAIGGQLRAFDELIEYWPEVLTQLGREVIEESREQYLRYAVDVWNAQGPRPGYQLLAALDVLSLLFADVDDAA